MTDLTHISDKDLATAARRLSIIARVALVSTLPAILAGIWIDYRWILTGVVLAVVGTVASAAVSYNRQEAARREREKDAR